MCYVYVNQKLCNQLDTTSSYPKKQIDVEVNTEILVRVYRYTSVRHYGGRQITTIPFIVKAKYLYSQSHTEVVELLEGSEAYPKGHKLAVMTKDFNI